MMKRYIRVFDNHSDYENYLNSGDMLLPNVSHCVTQDDVHYNPFVDYSTQYFTIESLVDNNDIRIIVNNNGNSSGWIGPVSYSLDDGKTWTEYQSNQSGLTTYVVATVNAGEKVLFKGENIEYNNWMYGASTRLNASDEYVVYGNIKSLVYGDNFVNAVVDENAQANSFRHFFSADTNLISAKNLMLSLYGDNYYMFKNCTNLVDAPKITFVPQNFFATFENCSSLIKEAELPSQYTPSHKFDCYCDGMYYGTGLSYDEANGIYPQQAYQEGVPLE